MSIIPDQFPGIVFEPKKTCFFPLQVVGSSNSKRFEVWVWVWWGQAGCERRMDDTKVYKHGRNDAEFCMLHLLPKNVKQTL